MPDLVLNEIKKMIKNHLNDNKFLLSEIEPALQRTQIKTKPEPGKTKPDNLQTTPNLWPKGKDFIEPEDPKGSEFRALLVQPLVELNSGSGQMQNLVERFSIIALRQLKGAIQLNELEIIVKKSMQLALTQILKNLKQK